MKLFAITFLFLLTFNPEHWSSRVYIQDAESLQSKTVLNFPFAKDTCVIEGLTFRMLEYKSSKKLKAIIKNSQIYIESKGLQYSKYRIIYYVFSSVDDEQMPVVRHFNQRLSPPVLKILKDAKIGNQFLIEEIGVVDPSNIELNNAVKPILLERIKN
jgi:hypothetical protein